MHREWAPSRKQEMGKKCDPTQNCTLYTRIFRTQIPIGDILGGSPTFNIIGGSSTHTDRDSRSIPNSQASRPTHRSLSITAAEKRERCLVIFFCARASLASGPFSCSVVAREKGGRERTEGYCELVWLISHVQWHKIDPKRKDF